MGIHHDESEALTLRRSRVSNRKFVSLGELPDLAGGPNQEEILLAEDDGENDAAIIEGLLAQGIDREVAEAIVRIGEDDDHPITEQELNATHAAPKNGSGHGGHIHSGPARSRSGAPLRMFRRMPPTRRRYN